MREFQKRVSPNNFVFQGVNDLEGSFAVGRGALGTVLKAFLGCRERITPHLKHEGCYRFLTFFVSLEASCSHRVPIPRSQAHRLGKVTYMRT